jgi:hypothetical protein
MFISFIGLVLASTVSAKVIDIQVGGANGTLEFSPEAVVSLPRHNLRFSAADDASSSQIPVTRLSTTSTPRTTP